MIRKYSKPLKTFILLIVLASFSQAFAQTFSIVNAGELKLGSSEILLPNSVNKYFGMNVEGIGDAIIKVTVGKQSAEKSYTFRSSPTKLSSFLLSQDLATELSINFRRGVVGQVSIEILDSARVVQDSVVINLDVTLKKNNCKKYPSARLKKCERLVLSKADRRNQKKLATAFARSIKGPIILEA